MAKLSQTFFVMIVAALFSGVVLAKDIYLKADATGEGTGESWTDACTTYKDALARLREVPNSEEACLHIAKGLYTAPSSTNLAATDPTVVSNAHFKILGGYRAQADGDMVRDPAVYQTILTGLSVAELKSAKWSRVTPVPQEFRYESQSSVTNIIDADGNLILPDYTGAHDTFVASTSNGHIPLYIYGAGTSGTVDGLIFACFNRGGSRNGIIQADANVGDLLITNCTFVGSCPQSGCIKLLDAQNRSTLRLIVDCRFLYNTVSYGGLGIDANPKGRTIVRRCRFEGASRLNTSYSISLFSGGTGDEAGERYAEDCVVTRNLSVADSCTTIAGGGLFHLRDVVMTNNYMSARGNGGAALFELSRVRYSSTGDMIGCLVADNYSEFKPAADSVAVLVNCYGSAQDDNAPLVKDCLFRDNALYADATGVASGNEFALGLVGNTGVARSIGASIVGCAFVSNRVTVVNAADGVTARKSRAIVAQGSGSTVIQYGIANCTFYGPYEAGSVDILQFKTQTQTMNIVNCLFSDDDPNAVTESFGVVAADKMRVYHCAIKNLYPPSQPTDYGVWSGVTYDPIPLAAVAFGRGDAMTLRPAAKVPDLRVTCDVATNKQVNTGYGAPDRPLTFAFRAPSGEWQALCPKAQAVTDNEKTPLADALETARAFGSYTRGATQALTPVAETGASLTLRTDPPLAGTFSAPANQAVAAGTAITPVTATSAQTLKGWYTTDDTLYSSANPLVINTLSSDLLLTAKFAARETVLTFNLGEHGVFTDNGQHSIDVKAAAGAAFPDIPAFTIDEGWFFAGWGNLPRTVPDDDTAYAAKVVTKAKRTFFVAPTASGTGDGSSWANATADFAAAYDDAATYVGEVRLLGGVYRRTTSVAARSNVAVIGGYAAGDGETPSDPAAHPTIFSGDVAGDDYWKIDGSSVSAGAIWNGTVFNSPNPERANRYWQAASATADNATYGFTVDANVALSNVTFRHVVFTGFGKAVFFSDIGATVTGLSFDHCRFLANGTAADNASKTITELTTAPMTVTDCEFVGNYGGISVNYTQTGVTNRLERCTFAANTAGCLAKTITSDVANRFVSFHVADCVFTNNYAASGGVMLSVSCKRDHRPSQITNCTVSGNDGVLISLDCSNSDNKFEMTNLEIVGCDFTDNVRVSDGGGSIISGDGRYYSVIVRDCYIARNVCTNTANKTMALVFTSGYTRNNLVDCTLEHNKVVTTGSGRSALVCMENMYGALYTTSTLMVDNEVVAATAGNAADFMLPSTSQASAHGHLIGCVIDETKYGQLPVRVGCATTPVDIGYCALRGFDPVTCGGSLTTNAVFTGDALVEAHAHVGANGNVARGLSGRTPCRKLGVPVWRGTDDNYYYRRLTDSKYICIGGGASSKSTAEGVALGMNLMGPFVPDAWGRARRAGKIAPGPLNAADLGFLLLVR